MAEEILKLHSESHLQRDVNGEVLLYYRGASYKADDVVPIEIYPDVPEKNRSDARAFVETVMLRDYGTSKRKWPILVKEFLAAKPVRKK
jgi:hypothetical protein